MINKEMTPVLIVINYLPDFQKRYDEWFNRVAPLNGERMIGQYNTLDNIKLFMDKEIFNESILAFEQYIRKDQHEKSCRAQKLVCTEKVSRFNNVIGKVTSVDIHFTPLADFNDTITE